MASHPGAARRNHGCPECGSPPERKSAKGPPPIFCSLACKKAMEARKLGDGRTIIAFAKAWRLSRNNPADRQLGAECLSAMSAILDIQNERDRSEGRTSAMTMGYAETLLDGNNGNTYRDRTDSARWKRGRDLVE